MTKWRVIADLFKINWLQRRPNTLSILLSRCIYIDLWRNEHEMDKSALNALQAVVNASALVAVLEHRNSSLNERFDALLCVVVCYSFSRNNPFVLRVFLRCSLRK